MRDFNRFQAFCYSNRNNYKGETVVGGTGAF